MKNKGFTLVELLGVIVLIAIVAGLAVISVNTIIGNGKKGVYQNHEKTLEGAAKNYFIDHIDNIPTVGGTTTLTMTDLNNYLEELEDPNGGNCSYSKVLVTRSADVSNNFKLNYQVCLICKNGVNETYSSDMDSENKFCH